MESSSHARSVGVFALCFLIACFAAHAGTGDVVVEPSPCDDPCEDDCEGDCSGESDVDWNPSFFCDGEHIEDTEDLISCFFTSANGGAGCDPYTVPLPPGPGGVLQGDFDPCVVQHADGPYVVIPDPRTTFKIRKVENLDEIDRLRFKETYPRWTKTAIEVAKPGLQAEIMLFQNPDEDVTADPNGVLRVTLNGRLVQVSTAHVSMDRLRDDLLATISRSGFSADLVDEFIVVYADGIGETLTSISFETQDRWVVGSEIALEAIEP